jgi:hypothetical protein
MKFQGVLMFGERVMLASVVKGLNDSQHLLVGGTVVDHSPLELSGIECNWVPAILELL